MIVNFYFNEMVYISRHLKAMSINTIEYAWRHWRKTLQWQEKNGEKRWKMVKNSEKLWKMVNNSEKRWKTVKKQWKTAKNGEKWWKTVKNDEKRWKTAKNGEKWWKQWKMAKNSEKTQFFQFLTPENDFSGKTCI